jgi:hypothetical protein
MTTVQPTNVAAFPALKPGFHLAPLAVGAPGDSQQVVYIECPDWCTDDHVENFVHFLEDVDHKGDEFSVAIPSFWNDSTAAYQLTAALSSDPLSSDPHMRDAHIVMGDSGSVDAYMTPDAADSVADDLIKMASQLRAAARTARLHNQFEAIQAVTA